MTTVEDMLAYNDPKWRELKDGYQVLYDPTPALKKLERGSDTAAAWDELWRELRHQSDVGEASYAAVPNLAQIHQTTHSLDWNLYALASTIEIARHQKKQTRRFPNGLLKATTKRGRLCLSLRSMI
ncbi:MAG: hypothetical protein J2P21_30390 [Chloracidobacterium sp.]|nr:hypothetical protein [Chloracidobacterium sp.]